MTDARHGAAARARGQGELQARAHLWRGAWPHARRLYTPDDHALCGVRRRALAPAHALAAGRRYCAALRRLDPGRLPQLVTLDQALGRRSGFRTAPAAGDVEPAEFFAERPYACTDLQTSDSCCDDLDRLLDEITAWTSRELLHARIASSRRSGATPRTQRDDR